jgi:hypothetical protein
MALTPFFWLVTYQMAANQVLRGVRVLSKMVPAVTVAWYLHELHTNRPRVLLYGSAMAPHLVHTKPSGQRNPRRYSRQAAS